MDEFQRYLQRAFDGFGLLEHMTTIHIVLGNESCDLDSTVSTLLTGFMIYQNCLLPGDEYTVVLPVMNVHREDFLLRTENCYVLKQSGIDIEKLIYRNEICLDSMFRPFLNTTTIYTHLVDHHILSKNDEELAKTVIEVVDHRPRDFSVLWEDNEVTNRLQAISITIEEVGSCATLIARDALKYEDMLDKTLAFLLYETIIYDTIALLPENGRTKPLDIEVAEKLENRFNFEVERKALFDELWAVHNNVSHLTPRQLLSKDLKIVDGVPVPGLPMLVEDYLKLPNVTEAIEQLSKEHSSDLIILIGLDAKQEVKRDVGVCYKSDESSSKKSVKDIFIDNLINSKDTKDLNFELVEREVGCNFIRCFRQGNTKLSRKQIVPVLKDSLVKYNSV